MRGVLRINTVVLVAALLFAPGMATAAPSCDKDGDGYLSTKGTCGGTDCRDSDANSYPGAVEVCDGYLLLVHVDRTKEKKLIVGGSI